MSSFFPPFTQVACFQPRFLSLVFLLLILAVFTLPANAHEAGYYGFQTPSQLPVNPSSLVLRASQIEVPANTIFSLHLLKGPQVVATSRTVFTAAYKNLSIFTGVAVATFRPTGSNDSPGENFPGATLYTGTADLNDVATNPQNYSFFYELSDGYLAPKDKILATADASFSFVDLKLNSIAAASRQSDQKPGSVLFYHRYLSSLTSLNGNNTTISITNTSPVDSARVRMFFINIADCSSFEQGVCLASGQTLSFSMRDFDPLSTGYCMAFACDAEGRPAQFNWLIGNAQIRQTSPANNQFYDASLSAIALAKRSTGSVAVSNNKAELAFDDVTYDRLPGQLAADNVPSQAGAGSNANATMLMLYRPIPDLSGGSINPRVDFMAYNNAVSTAVASQVIGCYGELRLSSLRFNPQLNTLISLGKTGWIKIFANDNGPLLGAQFNSGSYTSGTTLRALTYASDYRISVPIRVPGC